MHPIRVNGEGQIDAVVDKKKGAMAGADESSSTASRVPLANTPASASSSSPTLS
jgi:hypothetical protein